MSRATRAVFQDAVSKGHQRWARPRPSGNVVRLHRASRAAHVFSEIAKTHITHPLPDQLELAEEDLRAALDEMAILKGNAPEQSSQQSKRARPSQRENLFLCVSAYGFWALMLFNALNHFGAF